MARIALSEAIGETPERDPTRRSERQATKKRIPLEQAVSQPAQPKRAPLGEATAAQPAPQAGPRRVSLEEAVAQPPPSGGGGVMDTAQRSYADAASGVGSGIEAAGEAMGFEGAQNLGRSMQSYWGDVSGEAEEAGGVSVPDTLKGGYADVASGLGSILDYAGNRFGSRGLSTTGESMKAYWDRVAKESPMSETAQVSPYDDPKVLANPNWWVENTTRMAPSFALPAGAGGAGFKLASGALPGLPKIAAAFGAGVGGLFGGGLEGAQTYEEGLEMGQEEPTAARAGEAMALGSGILNAIPFYKILNPGARGVVRRFMAAGMSEGITEAAEEPLDAVIQGLVYDKETDWEDVVRSMLHVMPPAFLLGGVAGAGSPSAQAPETGAPTPETPPIAPQTPSARPGGELTPALEQDETALTGQPGEPSAPVEDVSLVGESPEQALADRMAREFPEEALEPGGPAVDAPAPGSVQDESMDLSGSVDQPTADVVPMRPDEEITMEGPADPDLADFLERRQQAPQQPVTPPEPVPGAQQGQVAPISPPQTPQEAGRAVQPAPTEYLETPDRPDVKIPRQMVPAADLQTDAQTYQYKEGADTEGVTDRLKGVQKWDDMKSGRVVVHEREDGSRYIADGHQRLGLAKKLESEGHPPINLDAIVLREADGFSVEDAKIMGAAKNMAEGTGTAWDAARIFRDSGAETIAESLPPNSAIVRDGKRLAALSDEATQAAINADVDPAYAGIAAQRFSDPTEQMAAVKALVRYNPATQGQAHALMADLAEAGTQVDQSDLFGGIDDSVMQARMRLIDRVQSRVRKDRAIMNGLVRNQKTIEGAARNVVDQEGSRAAKEESEAIARFLQHISTNQELNSYVTEQAKKVAAGEVKAGEAAEQVLERARASLERTESKPASRQEEQQDLVGGQDDTALKVRQEREKAVQAQRSAPPMDEGEGDLFSDKSKQRDVEDVAKKADAHKEPWEMTALEYTQSKVPGATKASGSMRSQHKVEVKAAIGRGETVPARVLSEYPDIQGQPAPQPPETPTTPKKKAKKKAAKQPTESKREPAEKADTKADRGTAMFSEDVAPETGQPVSFRYAHNPESATRLFGVPDKDAPYYRGYEPSGKYIGPAGPVDNQLPNLEYGTVSFSNPLVLNNKMGEWKKDLSDRYGGKAGKELSKAVIADGYDGIVTVERGGHISESVDLSTFDEAKAMYSMDDDSLIVLHNMSTEEFQKSSELGGLPVPSVAVTQARNEFNDFGDITLVGTKDMIDPSYAENEVYETDAYSPTFPRVRRKVNQSKLSDKIGELSKVPGNSQRGGQGPYIYSVEEVIERDESLANLKIDSLGMHMNAAQEVLGLAFLQDRGNPVEIPMKFSEGRSRMLEDAEVRKDLRGLPLPEKHLSPGSPEYIEYAAKATDITRHHLTRQYSKLEDIGRDLKTFVDDVMARDTGDDGLLSFGGVMQVYEDHKDVKNGNIKRPDSRKLTNRIKRGLRKEGVGEYNKWVDQKFDGVLGQPYIEKGRKKLPVTLENIVDVMTSGRTQARGEGMFFGLGEARAMAAKRFKNIKEMQDARDRIVPKSEQEAAAENIKDRFFAWQEDISSYYEYDNQFDALDDLSKSLGEFGKGPKTEGRLNSILRKNGYKNVPEVYLEDGVQLAKDMLAVPVEYFEAKPQRAVLFEEFAGAVVPRGTDKSTIQMLKDNGIKRIRYYKKFNAQDRIRAVRDFKDVMFNVESGEVGGMSVTDTTNSLRQIVGKKGIHKLFRSGRFNILPDQRALEEVVGERAESGGRVKGMYDPASKKSYLVAGNIRPDELTGVFLHEVGAHYGLPRMIGKGEYFKIKKQLQRLYAQEDPWVVAAYNRVPKNTPQQYWWDEVLAYTVEQNHQMPALRRMWSKMKAFLKELGVLHAMDMSSADMVELVRGAAGHAVRTAPKAPAAPVQDAAQPAMASKSGRRVSKDKLREAGMDFENLPGDPEGSQTRATEPVDQEPDTVDTDAAREQLRKRGYEGGPMFSVDSDQQDRGTIAHMITGEEKVTFHPATQQQNKLKRYLKRYFTKEGLLTDEAFARHVESMGIKNEDELVTQFMVDGMVKAARRAYKKPWMKISERDKAQMNEYLAGNNQADVSASVKRELDNMRTSLDALSGRVQEMLIDEIMYRLHALNPDQRAKAMELIRNRDQELTPESVEGVDPIVVRKLMMYRTIEGNKRQWLNRSYAVFDNDKWVDEVANDVKERARQYLMQQVEDSPRLSQMSDQAKADYVEGLMNKLLQPRARDLMSFMNSSQLGQKDLSVLKRRKDIAPEIRELMGEYKDPRVNYARSMGKMSYLVANHHFLRSVREDGLGVFLSSRPSGRMSEEITSWDQNQMAPLAGLYAPPEFAAALREAAEPAAMQSWMRNYMLYFNVPVKYGKAQPLGAVVHTPTGPTRMGDLSVGDVVCGAGKKTAVTGVYPQGKLDVYKLTFCDGSTTRASGEHLWEVIIDSKSRVVTTQDLLELPKWRIEKRQVAIPVDKAEFESQTTPLDPYLLGVIIGDGCLTSNMVRLSNPDREVIERVREALPEGYVMESPPSWADIDYAIKAENFSDAKRDGNAVRNALDELGLMGHKSLDKFIPESYKRNSEVVRMELMRGLLDTDGTVNLVGQPIFNTSSSQLAKDVQELAESLGASVLCNEKRTASGNTGYELNIRVHDARQWFHLSRKRDKASPRKKPLKRTIKSIEHDGQEECQCISVDDPRSLYMTDRFILTHNTVFSPTTMARNFLSASMFTVMNGHFNYSHVLKAGSHTWADLGSSNPAKLDYLRRMVRLGVLHDNPRARELREALDEALDMNALEGSLPARGVKTILNTATKMYRAGDDFWKIIGFENTKADLMRAGMPESEAEVMAADRVRNGYPTYSMVPGAIRGLRRFPVVGTFVSFPWEIMRNTRHQFRFLREDWSAGRYAMVGKRGVGMAIAGSIAHGISMATMAYFGLDDEDDEAIRQMAPEWQQNAQLAYLPPNEDGQMRYLDLSHLDPYTYLKIPFNALANGNYESLDEAAIAGMQEFLEPFLGSEIGFKALGQVWFNSTEYGPVYDENAHWSIRGKQIVWDHLRKELQPGLFSNVERTIKAWKDIYTSYGKKYELSDELLAWGGLRISTMEPEISLRFRSFEFNDQKSGANRPTYRAFRDPNIGAYEDIPGAVEQSKAQWREAFKGMHASIRAARKIGMDDGEIVMALKEGGVAGKYIGPLMGGHVPPWRPYEPTLSNARASLLKTRDDPAEKKALMQDFQKRRELLYQSLSQ